MYDLSDMDEFIKDVRGILAGSLVLSVLYIKSWIMTCGFIKLLCMLFKYPFSWEIATFLWMSVWIMKINIKIVKYLL